MVIEDENSSGLRRHLGHDGSLIGEVYEDDDLARDVRRFLLILPRIKLDVLFAKGLSDYPSRSEPVGAVPMVDAKIGLIAHRSSPFGNFSLALGQNSNPLPHSSSYGFDRSHADGVTSVNRNRKRRTTVREISRFLRDGILSETN